MSIIEAIEFFKKLLKETKDKKEIKVYNGFIAMLTQLKNRDFPQDEMKSIETELEHLSLKSKNINNVKFFKTALRNFEKFLRDSFSLTPKNYYTQLGIGIGMSFGILFGVIFLSSLERSLGIALGIMIGMLIGLVIGRSMDTKAINAGRVI
jgi:hypothetical protein